jgi:hypothetical protein
MEGSNRHISIKPSTKARVEHFWEVLQHENITLGESLALSGFLLSLVGILTGAKVMQSIAKTIFGLGQEIEDYDKELMNTPLIHNGIPLRNDLHKKDGEVSESITGNERDNSSIQDKG